MTLSKDRQLHIWEYNTISVWAPKAILMGFKLKITRCDLKIVGNKIVQ